MTETLINYNSKEELKLDSVIENTQFIPAEKEMLTQAQKIVAREYSYYMPEEQRDSELAFQDLCVEEFPSKSKTFVALYENAILGTVRLTFGDTERIPPLEAMDLIDVIDKKAQKSCWPHQELENNISIAEVCEVGRFVLSKEIREDAKVQLFVTLSLMETISNYAKEQNSKLMLAIMPEHVYNFTERNGLKLRKLNGDRSIIFKNSPKANEIRDKYSIYWQKLKPTLYTIDF